VTIDELLLRWEIRDGLYRLRRELLTDREVAAVRLFRELEARELGPVAAHRAMAVLELWDRPALATYRHP
jgi:hypothetical protein